MADSTVDVNGWEQLRLISPDVFEITVKFGAIPLENHYQWEIEVEDPTGPQLLAVWSRPHFTLDNIPAELAAIAEALAAWVDVATDPFRTL